MAPTLTLARHDSGNTAKLMDALCDVYADAYGVDPDGEKTAAFRTRTTNALDRPRYGLSTAQDGIPIVAFIFGYALSAGHPGETASPGTAERSTSEVGTRTFTLTEIEVRRDWQGEGVRRILNVMVLAQREGWAITATGPQADAARVTRQGWG